MLTIKSTARKLNISPMRVYQLITQNKLKAKKFGGIWIIKMSDLEEYKQTKQLKHPLFDQE